MNFYFQALLNERTHELNKRKLFNLLFETNHFLLCFLFRICSAFVNLRFHAIVVHDHQKTFSDHFGSFSVLFRIVSDRFGRFRMFSDDSVFNFSNFKFQLARAGARRAVHPPSRHAPALANLNLKFEEKIGEKSL